VDLRLVEYVLYLAGAVPLTLWAGRSLHRGLQLVGLGGVALLLTVDAGVASAADVVGAVATKLGVVLLLLGGLHLATLLAQRRAERTAESAPRPAAEYEPLRRASGRFPY
jgi:hypothetical protein